MTKKYRIPWCARTPAPVAAAIGMPPSTWAGNCTSVCAEILRCRLLKGELRRGLWVGPIANKGKFSNRPFTGHTWIRLPDGRVYDPTLFAFANAEPGIWVSSKPENKLPEYDFDGNTIRQAFRSPFPTGIQPDDKWLELKLSRAATCHVSRLTGSKFAARLTWRQACWIANLTLQELGKHGKEIYRALVRAGHGALIPYDNRQEVLGR